MITTTTWLIPCPIQIGFNSHGYWATFAEIVEAEQERANEPFDDIPEELIASIGEHDAIWVTRGRYEAFLYAIPAGEIENEPESLKEQYPDWKEMVEEIDCTNCWMLEGSDNGDGGILIIFQSQ